MVRTKRPRNAALKFAEAFTYLVAQEGCKMGKRRTLDARKLEKWARSVIRSAGGDPDKIGESVGKKLHWFVYDQRRKWSADVALCVKRGRAFAWRHRVIIAEQVLTGEAEPWGSVTFSLKTGKMPKRPAAAQVALYRAVLRGMRERKG